MIYDGPSSIGTAAGWCGWEGHQAINLRQGTHHMLIFLRVDSYSIYYSMVAKI